MIRALHLFAGSVSSESFTRTAEDFPPKSITFPFDYNLCSSNLSLVIESYTNEKEDEYKNETREFIQLVLNTESIINEKHWY